MRYAVDLDGTLCRTVGMDYANAAPLASRIEAINDLFDRGHEIVIDTARNVTHRALTESQLDRWGVKHHALRVGEKLPADVYVDDRAVTACRFFNTRGVLD